MKAPFWLLQSCVSAPLAPCWPSGPGQAGDSGAFSEAPLFGQMMTGEPHTLSFQLVHLSVEAGGKGSV